MDAISISFNSLLVGLLNPLSGTHVPVPGYPPLIPQHDGLEVTIRGNQKHMLINGIQSPIGGFIGTIQKFTTSY